MRPLIVILFFSITIALPALSQPNPMRGTIKVQKLKLQMGLYQSAYQPTGSIDNTAHSAFSFPLSKNWKRQREAKKHQSMPMYVKILPSGKVLYMESDKSPDKVNQLIEKAYTGFGFYEVAKNEIAFDLQTPAGLGAQRNDFEGVFNESELRLNRTLSAQGLAPYRVRTKFVYCGIPP